MNRFSRRGSSLFLIEVLVILGLVIAFFSAVIIWGKKDKVRQEYYPGSQSERLVPASNTSPRPNGVVVPGKVPAPPEGIKIGSATTTRR